jgi:hypothetical protein
MMTSSALFCASVVTAFCVFMMRNTEEEIICLRKCSEPNDKVKLIYDTLGYKDRPFIQKKSVVPQIPLEKNQNQINQDFTGGLRRVGLSISAQASHRTVLESLPSYGSSYPKLFKI